MHGVPEARNMVLFAWEDGRQPAMEMDLRQYFKTLGVITAKMHAHSSTWQRPEGFERFTWDFEAALGESPRWGHWRNGLGMDAIKLDLFGRTADLIRNAWRVTAEVRTASVLPTAICGWPICWCTRRKSK